MTLRALPQPTNPTAIRVGRRIHEMREYRGLSMEELGAVAGVGAGYISRLERGLSLPGVEVLERLARALGTIPAHIVNNPLGGPEEQELERMRLERMPIRREKRKTSRVRKSATARATTESDTAQGPKRRVSRARRGVKPSE